MPIWTYIVVMFQSLQHTTKEYSERIKAINIHQDLRRNQETRQN